MAEAYGVDPGSVEADPALAAPGAGTGWGGSAPAPGGGPEHGPDMKPKPAASDASGGSAPQKNGEDGPTPRHLAGEVAAKVRAVPVNLQGYETVRDLARLDAWIAEAREAGVVAFDTETTSLDAMQADLVGFSLATAPNRACYVPLAHRGEGSGDLFGGNDLLPGQIPVRDALASLKTLLEDPGVLKVAQNLKYDALVLARHGVGVHPADDTLLLSYVLDAGRNGHGMDELSENLLGHKPIQFGQVAGTGKSFIGFARVSID
ncbi:hypothetical protein WDZ92_47925, partial [Nostoc sp. NIES-2111]